MKDFLFIAILIGIIQIGFIKSMEEDVGLPLKKARVESQEAVEEQTTPPTLKIIVFEKIVSDIVNSLLSAPKKIIKEEQNNLALPEDFKEAILKEIGRRYYLQSPRFLDVGYSYGFSISELKQKIKIPYVSAPGGEFGVELYYSKNRINNLEGIDDNDPDNAEWVDGKITAIFFEDNEIKEISKDFSRFIDKFDRLKFVNFSKNKIETVDLKVFSSFYTQGRSVDINLRENPITEREQKRLLKENEVLNQENKSRIRITF